MKKRYEKPIYFESVAETTDVITTSSGDSLSDIVKNLASSATTESYDFNALFGA